MPEAGLPAPDFVLPAHSGESVRLSDFRGKKNVVLYFYPRDETPGCTREACDFRDAYAELARNDVIVLGVSKDPLVSHVRFAAKHGLPFLLLSDAQSDVAERYGVWNEKKLYGRPSMGIERTTFLIDKRGVLQKIFPRVSVAGHVDAIKVEVEALEG
jgi:peroxiredoxin Q/BCP